MVKIETLDIKHKELLSEKLFGIKVRLSEFSFANLYLFRKNHNYEIVFDDDCYFIIGFTNDRVRFVLPLCGKDEPDMDYIDNLLREFGMLFPISEEWLKYFSPDKYEIFHNPDDSDYIYNMERMGTLSGRHLSGKRNLVKQFSDTYECVSEEINHDNLNSAQVVLDKWALQTKQSNDSTDYYSAKEALTLWKDLNLFGLIYFIDDVPVGYVLGEGITNDTYALHFAKGITEFKGIYQFMYNDLAKKLLNKYSYINFEQDLGIESLRSAKSSYKPDFMGMKYRIRLN